MKFTDTRPEQHWNSEEGLFTVDSRTSDPKAPRALGLWQQFRHLMQRVPSDVVAILLQQPGPAGGPPPADDDSIEIVAVRGSPIYAAADGVVVRAGAQGGLGICIAIRHPDGHVTRYAHCDERTVKRDDVVKRGQVIGYVGDTGLVAEPLLRFDVIGPRGRYVDPYRFLRRCSVDRAAMEPQRGMHPLKPSPQS